ncbi:MAG: 50S ribosomal protein L11 methyltransferase, partial [Clostridiales bacterium]|nr:50S ribosomal protein L11 methyltransferase [Clostridiales bacterium]
MTFTELKIYASTMGLEAVGGVLDGAGVSCCAIQDPADLDALLADETVPADYVEESLRTQDGEPFLSVYLAQNEQGDAQKRAILAGVETLRGEFGDTLGSLRVETAEVCDDDWRDNWKQFFHPLEIGEKFVVRPSWEPYAGTRPLEIVIDPESSFGTGQHETTRLCLTALEGLDPAGKDVLDMGCGSGILGIGALKLGAAHVTA